MTHVPSTRKPQQIHQISNLTIRKHLHGQWPPSVITINKFTRRYVRRRATHKQGIRASWYHNSTPHHILTTLRHPPENNPDVMTRLAHELGLSQTLQFHEVYSLTEPTLLEFLPRPAYALLLVFPVTETYEKFRRDEDSSRKDYSASGPEEPVLWFKQTIRNACGLIGLLHVITNGEARQQIQAGSDLEKLLREAIPLDPVKRADLLYQSQSLEAAHATAAADGDSTAPDANAAIDLHFVAFIKDNDNNLWELDGRRKGPLNRGKLAADQDVLSEQGQEVGVRAFLRREEEAGGGELRFSVIMLGPSMD